MEENVADLIRGIVDRDEDALQSLYLRLSGEVFAIAFVRLHDVDAAEDVRQETFERVWSKAGDFQDSGTSDDPAHAWVLSIARNLTTDLHRRKSWETPLADPSALRRAKPAPDAEALCRNLDLRDLIEGLPRRLRDPVVLRVLAGYSLGECAEQLQVSIATVKRRCRSGLLALRERIERETELQSVSTE